MSVTNCSYTGVLALVMIAFAGAFVVVARWLVLRLAGRTSAEIARQIDRSAAAGRTAAYASAATERIRSIASANGVDVLHANALLLRRIERLATFMDAAVRVPLLGRVGFDALQRVLAHGFEHAETARLRMVFDHDETLVDQ